MTSKCLQYYTCNVHTKFKQDRPSVVRSKMTWKFRSCWGSFFFFSKGTFLSSINFNMFVFVFFLWLTTELEVARKITLH